MATAAPMPVLTNMYGYSMWASSQARTLPTLSETSGKKSSEHRYVCAGWEPPDKRFVAELPFSKLEGHCIAACPIERGACQWGSPTVGHFASKDLESRCNHFAKCYGAPRAPNQTPSRISNRSGESPDQASVETKVDGLAAIISSTRFTADSLPHIKALTSLPSFLTQPVM